MRLRTLGSGGRSRLALAAIPGMLDVDYNLVGQPFYHLRSTDIGQDCLIIKNTYFALLGLFLKS